MEYSSRITETNPTCENPDSEPLPDDIPPEEGCVCIDGYFHETGPDQQERCVPSDQCGCELPNGDYLPVRYLNIVAHFPAIQIFSTDTFRYPVTVKVDTGCNATSEIEHSPFVCMVYYASLKFANYLSVQEDRPFSISHF